MHYLHQSRHPTRHHCSSDMIFPISKVTTHIDIESVESDATIRLTNVPKGYRLSFPGKPSESPTHLAKCTEASCTTWIVVDRKAPSSQFDNWTCSQHAPWMLSYRAYDWRVRSQGLQTEKGMLDWPSKYFTLPPRPPTGESEKRETDEAKELRAKMYIGSVERCPGPSSDAGDTKCSYYFLSRAKDGDHRLDRCEQKGCPIQRKHPTSHGGEQKQAAAVPGVKEDKQEEVTAMSDVEEGPASAAQKSAVSDAREGQLQMIKKEQDQIPKEVGRGIDAGEAMR